TGSARPPPRAASTTRDAARGLGRARARRPWPRRRRPGRVGGAPLGAARGRGGLRGGDGPRARPARAVLARRAVGLLALRLRARARPAAPRAPGARRLGRGARPGRRRGVWG